MSGNQVGRRMPEKAKIICPPPSGVDITRGTLMFASQWVFFFSFYAKKGKVTSRLCRYPTRQKFCRNRSISLRFRDKRLKNFVKITLSRSVSERNAFFAFYTEIQGGRQKWRENDFWKKSQVDSKYTLWVKNFVETALSRSVSEINVFLQILLKIFDIYFCHYFATNKKNSYDSFMAFNRTPNYMPSYS